MAEQARATVTRRRRSIDAGMLVLVAVVVAVATYIAGRVGGSERVAQMWVAATVADDGSAQVVEVIDYDFGANSRHGIFRDVPQLRTDAPVEVSSPDAPDDVDISGLEGTTPQIRIGDPLEEVTGLHRYVIRYTLDGVVADGELAWDAVGTGWDVPIEDVEVHVLAAAELSTGVCVAGRSGSTDPCTVSLDEPGHLAATASGLDAREGITVSAVVSGALDAAPALPALPDAPASSGTDPLLLAALAGLLTLAIGLVTGRVLRRAGREHVPTVGVPVLAGPGEEARIDLEELAAHASPSPTLPAGLTPAQGGVLLTGSVLNTHKAAWLVSAAVAGFVDLDRPDPKRSKEIEVRRLAPGDPAARPVLDTAFRGRDRLVLGRYDQDFAAAWKAIGAALSTWQRSSGLWDAAAARRARTVRIVGTLLGLVGVGIALVGGAQATRNGVLALTLAVVGGALAGAGISTGIRGWELHVLTPQGASAWLQVEALRQFLATSPSAAVETTIDHDRLGEYTAWAVALGQADEWARIAQRVSAVAGSSYGAHHLRYVSYAPVFASSCASASVAPSSSSSGGGSVGGGSGGGGGGSW
jgi:hypothetical protein